MDQNDPWAAFNPQAAPSSPPQASPFGSRPIIQEAAPQQAPPSGYRYTADHSLEAIPGGPADPNKDTPKVGVSAVSGDEYLKQLDSGTSAMVKALADGRKAFPSGAALRSPYWQEMLTHVSNYDPGFDEVNYTARAATRRDFTSGKAANNIRALNTAIGHLGHLEEQIGGTASHDLVPFNAIENAGKRMLGDPGPSNWDATASALAGELTAVYRGSGGAEADINRYIQQLNANASQEQKVGVIHNIVGLLKSRLDALNDQYRQGMGTTAQQLQLLDPQAQLIVHRLGGFDAAGMPDAGHGNDATPPPGIPGSGPGPGGPPAPTDKVAPATGDTKDVIDSSLTPVRREYMARLKAGQSGSQLVSFLRSAGLTDPSFLASAAQQATFRRQHPDIPVEQYDTAAIDHHAQQMGSVNKAVNDVGQTALGAGVAAAGNSVLANFGPELVGATGGNKAQARLAFQYSQQDHPDAALLGNIGGGVLSALGGEAALAKGAGMAPGIARSLIADTAYGAASGAGASPDNRTEGAAFGAAAGALGSLGGQAITRGGGALVKGVLDTNVQKLFSSEIPLTIGQALGGGFKKLEDKATSIPVLGDLIQSRRAEGVRVFNSKAFDKALEPIGQTVGDQAGQDGIDKAREVVSQAFGAALKGTSAVPDETFIKSARGPLERLASNKRVGPEIVKEIEAQTSGLFDPKTGQLSGEHMQAFLDGLRQIRQGYKSDPLYQTLIKPSIQGVENSVEGMFARQAPEVMPAFNAAKKAYRRVSILSDAVNSADNTDHVFTPAQLRRSDLNNAKKFDGKMGAASGSAQFGDISGPAQAVLPSKVPDSGTAGRLAMLAAPGAVVGSGAALGYAAGDTQKGADAGIGLVGLLSLLYTKRGQSFLVNRALKRGPAAKAVGSFLQRAGPIGGAAGAAVATPSP